MEWPTALLRYQDIDHALQKIHARLTAIAETLADQSTLERARQALEQHQAEAKAARQAQKSLEFELDRVETKLKDTQTKLYGGAITNPRELQDLQAESKALKRRKSVLEDDLLDAMLTREEADAALEAAQAQEETTLADHQAQNETLQAERAQLKTEERALLQEMQALEEGLPPTVLESYRYLKSRTGGIPVAQLHGDTCSMCGVGVMKPTERKVHRGEEAYCGGCRRLIVA